MNFERLKRRVERAEQVVDGRIDQVQAHRARLDDEVRQAITPGRIVVAGLLAGFVTGRVQPMRTIRAVSATRWLQLATSLSGLFASLKASYAAETAETAAEDAGQAAETAEAVSDEVAGATGVAPAPMPGAGDAPAAAPEAPAAAVSDGRRRPDTQWEREPRPAEAATEISER